MRKLTISFLILLGSLNVSAQLMQTWIGMPDSICPYLSSQQRKHMVDAAVRNTFDTITNLLDGKSYVEAISIKENSMRVRLTDNMSIEITCTDSFITIEQVICAPLCSTLTRVYTTDWVLTEQKISEWNPELTEEEKKVYL